VKASQKEQPLVYALGQRCAERLHVTAPTIYVAVNDRGHEAHTLGTDDEAYVVLSGGLVAEATEAELADVIGRQCGKMQNGHVLPGTALFYLERFASRYVRWIVAPALATLRAWRRRAEVTCDRAGLLCTRDVDVSAAALRKTGVGAEYEEALRVFAESEYYRAMLKQPGGMTPEACDERVAEILKGKGGHDEEEPPATPVEPLE
jgi:Zn-dependent protease with chaperone function